MKKLLLLASVVVLLAGISGSAPAEEMGLMVAPGQMTWGPAPPVFQPGAEMAVVQGNPGQEGDYVVRLRMPDGYKIMPHWHPTAENVTVISGTLHLAMGERFDPSTGEALEPGSYASLPPRMAHYAWTEGAVEVQIHGKGPFALTYVNPADDPTLAAAPMAGQAP